MSVTNHNNSGRGLPGPILGIKILRPGHAIKLLEAGCTNKLRPIDDFRGACAVKGNGAVAGHVKL